MTKKQKKEIVKDLIKKWKPKLMLHEWEIKFFIMDTDYGGERNNAVALAMPNPDYTYCKIEVFKKAFVPPNEIEDTIVHELCHCLTENAYRMAWDLLQGRFRTHHEIESQRELLTERITKIVRGSNGQ